MATSKSEICNLALGRLGNYGSVSDIDTPDTTIEKTFAKWYDATRRKVLRSMIPNFALTRRKLSALATTPAFGYTYEFAYPNDCLKLLGIDEVEEKENNYGIEQNSAGVKCIQTDEEYDDGLPVRFIKDEEDVTKFSSDFVDLLSWELAYAVCMEVTQDIEKLAYMEKILPSKRASMGAVDSQENMPVRRNQSKFYKARFTDYPTNTSKK
jgi:hypothetical protein